MEKTSWINNIKSGHHAYLIAGESSLVVPELINFLESKWHFEQKGNPDFVVCDYDALYIERCQDIVHSVSSKPIGDKSKIVILSFGFMTREAANALLKIFEEPADTIFFVITPNPDLLPATLLSRFSRLNRTTLSGSEMKEIAKEFTQKTIGARFEFSKQIASDISDGKITRQYVAALFEALEQIYNDKNPPTVSNLQFYKTMESSRNYINNQASSVKLLLDNVALLLEEFKNNF